MEKEGIFAGEAGGCGYRWLVVGWETVMENVNVTAVVYVVVTVGRDADDADADVGVSV